MRDCTFTGKKLQAWRESKGWPRSYLAAKLNKNYQWIWRLEISAEPMPIHLAILFAAVEQNIEPLK